MAVILTFVPSYIRYYCIEGDGDNRFESSYTVKVSFPVNEDYAAVELIDPDVLAFITSHPFIDLAQRAQRANKR